MHGPPVTGTEIPYLAPSFDTTSSRSQSESARSHSSSSATCPSNRAPLTGSGIPTR